MYLYYLVNKQASDLTDFTQVIYYHGMKIPSCSFIRACLFIKKLKFFHPACLLEPARLLGRQEYLYLFHHSHFCYPVCLFRPVHLFIWVRFSHLCAYQGLCVYQEVCRYLFIFRAVGINLHHYFGIKDQCIIVHTHSIYGARYYFYCTSFPCLCLITLINLHCCGERGDAIKI